MKTIKCSQVGGGTCAFEVTTNTMEDSMTQFGAHARVAHADMMKVATPESMKKWEQDFEKTWNETPDN